MAITITKMGEDEAKIGRGLSAHVLRVMHHLQPTITITVTVTVNVTIRSRAAVDDQVREVAVQSVDMSQVLGIPSDHNQEGLPLNRAAFTAFIIVNDILVGIRLFDEGCEIIIISEVSQEGHTACRDCQLLPGQVTVEGGQLGQDKGLLVG